MLILLESCQRSNSDVDTLHGCMGLLCWCHENVLGSGDWLGACFRQEILVSDGEQGGGSQRHPIGVIVLCKDLVSGIHVQGGGIGQSGMHDGKFGNRTCPTRLAFTDISDIAMALSKIMFGDIFVCKSLF